jgi:hypothetical protein
MAAGRYAYPKFRFIGLVDLTYRDVSTTSQYYGRKSESQWTNFEQRYKLGLKGYVYHPKFITYSTSISYLKGKTDYKEGLYSDTKMINYDCSAFIFRTLPVSLEVYGLKFDSTSEVEGFAPYDYTSNSYGARLYVTKREYPSIILEYDHWDYTIEREKIFSVKNDEEDNFFEEDDFIDEDDGVIVKKKRVKEKTALDRFSINVKGFLKAINTNYDVTGSIWDYTSPNISYKGKNLTTNTNTVISKNNRLYTSFQYFDADYMKQTRVTTSASLSPIGRLSHSYRYEYNTSETDGFNRDSHTVSNYLNYRFSSKIFANARFLYRLGKSDGVREDFYNIDLGLNYSKTVRDYDFTSYYRFTYSRKEESGDYTSMQNSLGVSLSTRKFTWGKIYANYDISHTKYDFSYFLGELEDSDRRSIQFDSLEHRFRVGMNRKLPRRAYCNIEAEARIVDSESKDNRMVFWLGQDQWAEKIRHYTLWGDVGYPVGLRGFATFKASYTTGQTNSENVENYYYEGRFNYRLLRNLNLLAWWREEWRSRGWWAGTTAFTTSTGRAYGWRTREYQIEVNYLLYRTTISLEYNAYWQEEGSYTTEYKQLYLKLSRAF